jgi:hypothetical protein
VSDEAARNGPLLEQLGTRFDLVLEAVTGFGGRLESLREELRGQFTEIGRQIRFLSEQIAINRASLAGVKQDLTAEIVRLGEELGKTRVAFAERAAAFEARLQEEAGAAREATEGEGLATRERLTGELAASTAKIRAGVNESATAATRKLEAELKRTSRMLAALDKKFDRFDDRITIQTRDHEQRMRKLERRARG